MLDPIEFGKAMAEIVREHTAPLLARIAALEARQLERGDKGDPGDKGVAGDRGEQGLQGDRGLQGDKGEAGGRGLQGDRGDKGDAGDRGLQGDKGEQGNAGMDADPIDVREVVAELLRAPELVPLIALHVAEGVQKHFEANPVKHGVDGKPGENGNQGDRGEKGESGTKGDAGDDGVGLAGAMIDREGCLIVTTTKGTAINLGSVVGKNGDPGKDGADLSTVSIEYDGHRTLSVKPSTGEVAKNYKLGIPMDAGYWREGMACEKGDIVTHAGNAWIALADTKSKPSLENKENWRLFARKGRDGADGTNGRNLGPAPPVKLNSDA